MKNLMFHLKLSDNFRKNLGKLAENFGRFVEVVSVGLEMNSYAI